MSVLFWIALGLFAGIFVALVMQDQTTFIRFLDIMLGIVGAVFAGFIADMFQMQHIAGVYDETILIAVAGAGILIWLGRTIIIRNQE